MSVVYRYPEEKSLIKKWLFSKDIFLKGLDSEFFSVFFLFQRLFLNTFFSVTLLDGFEIKSELKDEVSLWLGREGQEAMNPVENLRTLWNGLRTPWRVSEPHGGGFLKKTLSNINITCKLAIIFQSSRHMDLINIIIKLKK